MKYRRIGIQHHGEQCWVCGHEESGGDKRPEVEVHHLHGRRGAEIAETLLPLCRSCHGKVHSDTTHGGRLGMVETEYRATNTYAGEESTGARLTLIDGDWHFEQSNMKTITLKVDTETRDALDKEADENGFESRSAYLRDIIERRGEATAVRTKYETQIDELEAELDRLRPRAEATDDLEAENEHLRERVDELETELERVKNEKRLLLEEREEKAELVRYVEQERTVEQRWREAGLWTRAKWKVLGMPTDETSA